jgi:hypothetical protein
MTKNIVENNRLIAIFMGDYQKLSNDEEFGKFHSSWDWLMPVVEKIEHLKDIPEGRLEFLVEITLCACEIHTMVDGPYIYSHENSKLEAVYNGVVKFIKRYSKENDKNSNTDNG